MRVELFLLLTMCLISPAAHSGERCLTQHGSDSAVPQTLTLYPPFDKASGKYDPTWSSFNFRLGTERLPASNGADLRYGHANVGGEDWLMVGNHIPNQRTVMREIGEYRWSDPFEVPVLDPLPKLKEGERRQITVDTSGVRHKQSATTQGIFAKAKPGYMYVMHVKDEEVDFYVLFRVEELEQTKFCTISWKRIPAPDR